MNSVWKLKLNSEIFKYARPYKKGLSKLFIDYRKFFAPLDVRQNDMVCINFLTDGKKMIIINEHYYGQNKPKGIDISIACLQRENKIDWLRIIGDELGVY